MNGSLLMAVVLIGLFCNAAESQHHKEADLEQSNKATHKQTYPQPNWDIRYKSGSFRLTDGQWLRGAFVPAEAVNNDVPNHAISVDERRDANKPGSMIAIPLDEVDEVYFDAKAEKDSYSMQQMSRSGCHYAQSLMPKEKSSFGKMVFVASETSPGGFSRA